jgi:hypothetical protein
MPGDPHEKQDHPYVAHYEWSSVPGAEDPERLTAEQEARNTQHALDKEAVEGGRALRLILAAPIVVWSFVGIPVLALFVLGVAVGAFEGSLFEAEGLTPGLAGLLGLLILIEVTSIWEALLLLRNQIDPRRWLIVLALSMIVAAIVTLALARWEGMAAEGWLAAAAACYSVAIAAWQLRRSCRLAPAAERLEQYSP